MAITNTERISVFGLAIYKDQQFSPIFNSKVKIKMVMFVCYAFDYSDCQQHKYFGFLCGLSLLALSSAKSAPATAAAVLCTPPCPIISCSSGSEASLALFIFFAAAASSRPPQRITLGDRNFHKFFLVLHSKDSRTEIEILRMLCQERCVWLVILCLFLWMLTTPFPLLILSIGPTAFD